MSNKDKYRQLCQQQEQMPIFMQDWWLDSVCGNSWQAVVVERDNTVVAAMPYCEVKKYTFSLIVPACFTPVNGVWIKGNLSSESYNNIMEELAGNVNSLGVDYFACHLSPKVRSWLGFYWQGFSSSLRYTYKIDISDMDKAFDAFAPKRRQYIRGAQKEVSVSNGDYDMEYLYSLFANIFLTKKQKVPVPIDVFTSVVQQAQAKGQGKMFLAKDMKDKITAFLFVVWDNNTCYNLISARASQDKDNHSESLLIFEAMKDMSLRGIRDYDMEGSMIKGVERYFRSFGGVQTPYIAIEKYYSPLYKFLRTLKHH